VKPIRRYFLEANPNPERRGCPDEKNLRHIAENRLPADHPARLHLGTCSPCFAEFRGFKEQFESTRSARRRVAVWAIAACLLVGIGLYGARSFFKRSEPGLATGLLPAQQAVFADRTIDLFNHGTVRGHNEPYPLEAVSLPSAVVHYRLILPRFSDPGSYVVVVSKDKAETDLIAQGSGKTIEDGSRLLLEGLTGFETRKGRVIFLGKQCARATMVPITIPSMFRIDNLVWLRRDRPNSQLLCNLDGLRHLIVNAFERVIVGPIHCDVRSDPYAVNFIPPPAHVGGNGDTRR
jgi:hypothetical protein